MRKEEERVQTNEEREKVLAEIKRIFPGLFEPGCENDISKAIEESGSLKVTGQDDGGVWVEIDDSGLGKSLRVYEEDRRIRIRYTTRNCSSCRAGSKVRLMSFYWRSGKEGFEGEIGGLSFFVDREIIRLKTTGPDYVSTFSLPKKAGSKYSQMFSDKLKSYSGAKGETIVYVVPPVGTRQIVTVFFKGFPGKRDGVNMVQLPLQITPSL